MKEKGPFEYSRLWMNRDQKKSFVHNTVEINLERGCYQESIGMRCYREAQGIALRNGKWTRLVCYDNGVHVSSLRSPYNWGLSTGNAETSKRLQKWWNWLRKSNKNKCYERKFI